MENTVYRVYAMVDESSRINDINSNFFLDDVSNWVQIDEGTGVPDGEPAWRERTPEEMDEDYVPPEPVAPLKERVGAVEIKTGDLEEALDMILSGVTE